LLLVVSLNQLEPQSLDHGWKRALKGFSSR
jgi:hypothetical protein